MDSAVYLSTNVIAFIGQVLTHTLQPKHRSGLKEREPSTIFLAPNWHRSTQSPQSVQADASVTEIA